VPPDARAQCRSSVAYGTGEEAESTIGALFQKRLLPASRFNVNGPGNLEV
jgi:hypothetical protein